MMNNNLPDDGNRKRCEAAIHSLVAVCGLSREEVAALTWGNIGELDGQKSILLMQVDQGYVRTVRLPTPIWRQIMTWGATAGIPMEDDDPVFPSVRGIHPIILCFWACAVGGALLYLAGVPDGFWLFIAGVVALTFIVEKRDP